MEYKVARFKTALNGVGKKLVADLEEIPKKIDAKRKRVRAPVGCVTGHAVVIWSETVPDPDISDRQTVLRGFCASQK
jgi:hypothetical protein